MENTSTLWPPNNQTTTSWPTGSCLSPLREVDWSDVAILASFIVLGVINVIVIGGNTLVIMAVFLHSKLRSVTNLFIVSLAVADLLVGVTVLPFSTTYEVLNIWVFGDVWCTIWLAVDVWLCTASILNLCAISLDRYLAVTRPVSYPSLMSSRRAKGLIAGVWCISFIICLPPLLGWNDTSSSLTKPSHTIAVPAPPPPAARIVIAPPPPPLTADDEQRAEEEDDERLWEELWGLNATGDNNGTGRRGGAGGRDDGSGGVDPSYATGQVMMGCQCELISDRGYRIYSALGSFYLPMLVMMFFYWRIYKAAVETTRAINQGFKTTTMGGRFDEQRLTLRIHRGRSSNDYDGGGGGGKTNGTCSKQSSFRQPKSSNTNTSFRTTKSSLRPSITFPPSTKRKCRNHKAGKRKDTNDESGGGGGGTGGGTGGASSGKSHSGSSNKNSARHQWLMVNHNAGGQGGGGADSDVIETEVTVNEDGTTDKQNFPRMGKRNIKAQVKRFKMETKAAKTLGIIVGGFILCWLPFFTIYLVGAFCDEDCIPEALFSVFFWLGYCNSAINPCVYALFSRDFRYAFKKILCKCTLRDEVSIKERIVTMFPPTVHLSSFGEEGEGGSDSH